jgi:magnesium-transporting ATPase (P-type)
MIMDTLASLALCTEKPTRNLLDRKPYGRKGSLVSYIMIRNIVTLVLFQVGVLLLLVYDAYNWWNIPSGQTSPSSGTQHYTLVFNTFVWLQIFNLINCRRVNDEKNVFQGIHKNWLFLVIFFGIIVVQIIIVEFGGVVFQCVALNWSQWLASVGFGFLSIPLGTFSCVTQTLTFTCMSTDITLVRDYDSYAILVRVFV